MNMEFKEVETMNSYLVRESSQKNKSKYCRFHKSHDHNTNDYIQLNDLIEGLIKKG